MHRLIEFIDVYRLYRIHHDRVYALRSAYRIAIQQIPF